MRIGRNGQSGFWCGFCKKVVGLRCRGLEAWDERFDHIDDYHFKRGERIDESWYPLESDIPKGLLRNENVLDSGGLHATPDKSESESSEEGNKDGEMEEMQCDTPVHDTHLPPDSDLTRRQQRVWYCVSSSFHNASAILMVSLTCVTQCRCRTGPYNKELYVQCMNEACSHGKCTTCIYASEREARD